MSSDHLVEILNIQISFIVCPYLPNGFQANRGVHNIKTLIFRYFDCVVKHLSRHVKFFLLLALLLILFKRELVEIGGSLKRDPITNYALTHTPLIGAKYDKGGFL